MNDIACEIIRDLLPLYHDGVCSTESKAAVENHLQNCSSCRTELENIRKSLTVTGVQASQNITEWEKVMNFARFIKKNKEKAYRKGVSVGVAVAAAATAIAFYLLPLLIKDTGSGMFILLFVLPVICFISALSCGITAGIKWYYSVLITVLFIPTIFIYFNLTAAVYIVLYGVIAFVGNLIGGLIHKLMHRSGNNQGAGGE